MLSGMFLGPKKGMAATTLFVLLGLVGLPVFAQGASGLGRLLGPTGGYLLGFILSAGISGGVFRLFRRFEATSHLIRLGALIAGVAGTLAVYAVGAPWLKVVNELSWESAIAFGIVPFLVGDLLKILVLGFVAPRGLALFRPWD
jgi:biotin transport system substrate-specific component